MSKSRVSIPPAEGEALRLWVQRENSISTIEVGLGYGVSALAVCTGLAASGHADARHVALDPNQSTHFSNAGLQALEDAGFTGLLDFYPEESQIALPRLLTEGRRFDLAFVDGNHRFDGVFLDLVYLGRLVRGGIVFLDDYQLPAVGKAVCFCVTNLGWAIEEESREDDLHNWVVLRTPAEPLERSFDHFVDF